MSKHTSLITHYPLRITRHGGQAHYPPRRAGALRIALLLLAALAPGLAGRAAAQNPCLTLLHPDRWYDTATGETYMNKDSVLYDSCQGSPTYLEYYATKGFGIGFSYYVIKRQPAPFDTTVELSWTAIDTTYGALRTAFAALEAKYGTLHLFEVDPDSYDSTEPGSRDYAVHFDTYVCVDSVLADFAKFPDMDTTNGLGAAFGSYPTWTDGLPGSVADPKAKGLHLLISPDPARATITLERSDGANIKHVVLFDALGRRVFEEDRAAPKVLINTEGLSAGVYVLVCDDQFEAKVIVAR